jgi:SAM-dependent methyltransferase
MKRVFDENEPEFMDRPQPVTPEFEAAASSLASLNRNFGSHRLIRHFLGRWLNAERCYRVLDLCTGSGEISRMMCDWARERGITLRIDAVDVSEAAIEVARSRSADHPQIEFIRDSAIQYEPGATYDLVCCSLALHHFSELDAIKLLRRCSDLSHRYVLVADLERGLPTMLAVRAATTLVYRDPAVRADGLISARRAFSFREMRGLAEAAGWTQFGHARFLLCRQALWLDDRHLGDIPLVDEVGTMPSPA